MHTDAPEYPCYIESFRFSGTDDLASFEIMTLLWKYQYLIKFNTFFTSAIII